MAILGGSPLGLIGVLSTPTRDGMSTFNGGRSRNVNVNLYNVGKEGDQEKLAKTNNKNGGLFSVFTGGNLIRPWPGIGTIGKEKVTLGIDENFKGITRRTLHNNDVYDTSILNIIEKLAGTSAALRPTDFAYLKKVGVYSNNRLVIARRFAGPVNDDIYSKSQLPLAVMICWRKEDEDFIEINFGEHWVDAKADFTDLLNNMAKDFTVGPVGTVGGAAGGILPLPGFTENLTRELLKTIGILDENGDILPAGNPNLIKQAKRRKTVPQGEAESGLKCTVSIKMTVEYEQKFISGIDPTIVFQDIIANALRFGTSPSENYGVSKNFASKVEGWVSNPGTLVTSIVSGIQSGVTKAQEAIKKAVESEYDAKIKEASNETPKPQAATASPPLSDKQKLEEEKKKATEAVDEFVKTFTKVSTDTLKKTVQKYKEEIVGILKALSGLPSTPWHVTVGNPLRPIFCSGDLYISDNVALKMGPTLAFNDLPSYITLDFTLTNARPWGAQEIMAKFNSGYLRTVNMQKDFSAVPLNELAVPTNLSELPSSGPSASGVSASNPDATISNNSNNSGGSASVPNSGTSPTTTKENQEQPTVNPDPNSSNPPVQGETTPNPPPPPGLTNSTVDTPGNNQSTPNSVTSGVGTFTVVSEEVEIASGITTIYAVSGTYLISDKEVKAVGSGESEDRARSDARRRAKKKINE
jgi:hypothetical protein